MRVTTSTMANPITVYVSTVAGNLEVKKKQQKIEMVLASKKVPVDYVDVAASEEAKAEMRERAGDPKALPPQFVHKEHGYLGTYEAFDEAIEREELYAFLKWTPPDS